MDGGGGSDWSKAVPLVTLLFVVFQAGVIFAMVHSLKEAIKEIKSDPELRQIPVVVLTTSQADEDIYKSYDLGVNSYIVKPVTFEALVDILQTLEKYWFEIVELPPDSAT